MKVAAKSIRYPIIVHEPLFIHVLILSTGAETKRYNWLHPWIHQRLSNFTSNISHHYSHVTKAFQNTIKDTFYVFIIHVQWKQTSWKQNAHINTDIKLDTKYCHWQDYKTHVCVFIRLISAICTSTAECLDSGQCGHSS